MRVRVMRSTDQHQGTLNLFTALNVVTDEIKAKTTQTKKRPDFRAFMDDVVADTRKDQEIHVILDNYSTHKKNHEWLEKNPNVYFHFTPHIGRLAQSSGDWLGILTR